MVEKKPELKDVSSNPQLEWRHMYQKAVALWHALSSAEKQEWESLARPKHMTGFAWFMSQCLRPNPGIYLPLQGGTMSGDIDMAKNRLLKLPLPTDDQEAASKTYVDTEISDSLYTEGARAFNDAAQSIPNNTTTSVAFNSEEYDTDDIHDPVAYNSRLTCKTAGIYIALFLGRFDTWAAGARIYTIRLSTVRDIAQVIHHPSSEGYSSAAVVAIRKLIVGDYLEARVHHMAGRALDLVRIDNVSPEFITQRIG